jgi:hypothetical protein
MKSVILGNSIVSRVNVSNIRTVAIPGLDWERAQKWMIENRADLRDTYVYVMIGPVRFTRVHKSRKEVVFVEPPYTVNDLFKFFYTELKAMNIKPVICPLYPIDFTICNEKKAKNPIMTSFYKEWNEKIKRYVIVENRSINYFNEEHGVLIPQLSRRILHRHHQRYSFRANLLTDGLHPKPVIISEWAREFAKTVRLQKEKDGLNMDG